MNPDQITEWLDGNLHRFDQPAQFLGDEPGGSGKRWDDASVRWLLAASWPYFHSAGNQSIPAVCFAVNNGSPSWLADRSYLPETPRDLKILEKAGVPVFGVETRHQLLDFDVAATSISYMVLFMNWCKLLSASGVPLRRSERVKRGRERYPMVMVGGQAYGAPGAMEPVVDCVWLGEVEDEAGNGGISQVCKTIEWLKQTGMWARDRTGCYEILAHRFNYLYFPEFTEVDYGYEDRGLEHPSKVVTAIRSVLPGQRFPLKARKIKDMDEIRPLPYAPLLWADPSMGAGDIEEARGCPAWCSFCRLSWETKPYRQRSVGKSVEHAREWQLNMGTVELSPFGPDFPMHTQKKRLLSRLLAEVGDEIDGTAMRIDDFIADEQYVLIQSAGGADAVTLGLEGNSQRMRDLVGKGTSDADVEKAVITGIRAGFRKFKLYMITNLPGENEGDVMRIVRLGHRLNAIRQEMGQPNVRFQFSWTPLLIEAQTPFQWFAPTPPDHTLINVADLFRDLKIEFKIGTKAEPNKVALFQLMQRASRDVGEAIVDVFEKYGAGSWGGVPPTMKAELDEALREHGFRNGLEDCFDERYRTDLFGWEHISTGVSGQLLWDTYRQMLEFLLYTESGTYDDQFGPAYHGQEWVARCDTQCLGRTCGVCDKKDLELRRRYITAPDDDLDLTKLNKVDQTSVAFRVRVSATKVKGDHRFVSNDSWRFLVRRGAYRAAAELGLPGISKRTIKLASDIMRVREHTSGTDYVDFGMTRPLGAGELEAFMWSLTRECSEWLQLGSYVTYPKSVTPPAFDLALYEQPVTDGDSIAARLRWWSEQESIPLRLRLASDYFGGTEEVADARVLAPALWLVRDGSRILLRSLVRRAGPYHILMALTGRPSLIEAASVPARRIDYFLTGAGECRGCGMPVPVPVLGDDYPDECPSCLDKRYLQVIAMTRIVTEPVR